MKKFSLSVTEDALGTLMVFVRDEQGFEWAGITGVPNVMSDVIVSAKSALHHVLEIKPWECRLILIEWNRDTRKYE